MDMQGKAELIYRGILLILFIVFLFIFWQYAEKYAENGRYTYYHEVYDNGVHRYVVDTRTGTLYGHFHDDENKGKDSFCYKRELRTNKEWIASIIVNPPISTKKEPKPPSVK